VTNRAGAGAGAGQGRSRQTRKGKYSKIILKEKNFQK
jgi:hypothetical protein